jgi:NitT/TauT family transport system substrate-binding protein
MLKRFYVKPLCMLLATVLLAACTNLQVEPPTGGANSSTLASQQLTELDVCDAGSNTNLVLLFAQESGLFEKYGLAVNLLPVSGAPEAIAALIAGEVDICHAGGQSAVNASLAGEEMVITAGIINAPFFSLVVLPGIETVQDLQDKVVAAGNIGSGSDTFLRIALSFLGLEPDADVTIINLGRSADRLAAMETGQVVGAAVTVPDVVAASKLGFNVLLHASQLNMPYQHTAVVMSRSFLDHNRQTVLLFTQAVVEAIARMKQDREWAIRIMADNLRMDLVEDAIYLDGAYETLVRNYLPQVPYPTREGIQVLIDVGRAENPLAVELTPDDLVDDSIVRELEESGFIDNLYIEK